MARSYEHLTLDERRKLDRWRDAEVSISEIAQKLGRARSTVYRELKRNHFSEPSMPKVVGYFAMAAHKMAEIRLHPGCRRHVRRSRSLSVNVPFTCRAVDGKMLRNVLQSDNTASSVWRNSLSVKGE